tara:strand:+ start:429 stop:560 length:132 start_codon:yes stop_codon:yes gene_type:complete
MSELIIIIINFFKKKSLITRMRTIGREIADDTRIAVIDTNNDK